MTKTNILIKIGLFVLFLFFMIGIDIVVREFSAYYKNTDDFIYRNHITNRLRYEIFTKEMTDRVLGYMSGDWRSATGSQIHFNLLGDLKTLSINDDYYDIVTIDKVDTVFGIVQLTAREHRNPHNVYRFQINKIFETTGLIVMIFDSDTKSCKEIQKIDPNVTICAKALYWWVPSNDDDKTDRK